MADQDTVHALSADRLVLTIRRRLPAGIRTVTLRRDPAAGPFTDADVTTALSFPPSPVRQPGQRNITRRRVTRFGTLWTHLMTGPPTWRRPRVRLKDDGTLMAGWLRLAVAVKFDRAARKEHHVNTSPREDTHA